MKKYLVKTLGCKANLYDSQLIEAELSCRGWAPAESEGSADLCVVNSCTVTDEADRQSRKLASRLLRDHPGAAIVITGCAAEVDPERLLQSRGVHYVIGNRDKPKLVDLVLDRLAAAAALPRPAEGEVLGGAQGYDEIASRHPMDREWALPEEAFLKPPTRQAGVDLETDNSLKTRAFLKIQEGCNSFCTYCIIPYGRGPSRSLRPREVLAQVRALVAEGIQEIVITGTNIGDYGTDWAVAPETTGACGIAVSTDRSAELVALFRMIFAETGLKRLRVSSLDPTEISPSILQLAREEPRFCPHFHVSLQSASDRVLRLMKRRYGTREIRECLTAIAGLGRDAFVGMDVITGFPGETDEEFAASFALLAELPWQRLHVFPYSEREGTPATRLPGVVPSAVRAERAKRLSELSLSRMKSHYERALAARRVAPRESQGALTAQISQVLFERAGRAPSDQPVSAGARWYGGYSPEYLRVWVELPFDESSGMPAGQSLANRELSVVPTGLTIDAPAGEVAFVGRLVSPERDAGLGR